MSVLGGPPTSSALTNIPSAQGETVEELYISTTVRVLAALPEEDAKPDLGGSSATRSNVEQSTRRSSSSEASTCSTTSSLLNVPVPQRRARRPVSTPLLSSPYSPASSATSSSTSVSSAASGTSARRASHSGRLPSSMRKAGTRVVSDGSTLEELAQEELSESLDPYTWERPLDSVQRHSRLFDMAPPAAVALKTDPRRASRIQQIDPFGFSVASEPSSYDAALVYSARPQSTSRMPSANSLQLSGSISSGLASQAQSTASSPALSQNGQESPFTWQQQQRQKRSASAGDVPNLGRLSTHGMVPSKLSGEIGNQPDSPTVDQFKGIVPEDKDYLNSKLYQRTMKAQKALEKERARGKLAPSSTSDDPLVRNRLSRVFSDVGSFASTGSKAKRKSFGWFRSASEVALPMKPMVSEDEMPQKLPMSKSAAQLPLDAPMRPYSRSSPVPPPSPIFTQHSGETSASSSSPSIIVPSTAPKVRPSRSPAPQSSLPIPQRPTSRPPTSDIPNRRAPSPVAAPSRPRTRSRTSSGGSRKAALAAAAAEVPLPPSPSPGHEFPPPPSSPHLSSGFQNSPRSSSPSELQQQQAAHSAGLPPPSTGTVSTNGLRPFSPPVRTSSNEYKAGQPIRSSSTDYQPSPPLSSNGSAQHVDGYSEEPVVEPRRTPEPIRDAYSAYDVESPPTATYPSYMSASKEEWLAPPRSSSDGPSLPPGAAPPTPARKRKSSFNMLMGAFNSGGKKGSLKSSQSSRDEEERVFAEEQRRAVMAVRAQAAQAEEDQRRRQQAAAVEEENRRRLARAPSQPRAVTQQQSQEPPRGRSASYRQDADRPLAASAPPTLRPPTPSNKSNSSSRTATPTSPSKKNTLSKSSKEREKGLFARAKKTLTATSDVEIFHPSQQIHQHQSSALPPPPIAAPAAMLPSPPPMPSSGPTSRPLQATVPPSTPSKPRSTPNTIVKTPKPSKAVNGAPASGGGSFFSFGRAKGVKAANLNGSHGSESSHNSSNTVTSWVEMGGGDKSLPKPPPQGFVQQPNQRGQVKMSAMMNGRDSRA